MITSSALISRLRRTSRTEHQTFPNAHPCHLQPLRLSGLVDGLFCPGSSCVHRPISFRERDSLR
ncbi:MAG: hypothetical protein OJF47_000630 [Nitrospira sp.]|nr:MAG: hypothetical protein OJF47_000630 [Nitrospira sp.]